MGSLEHLTISTNFGLADWAIVVIFLVVSTVLGLYAQKYIRNMDDYVVAGRAVKTYLGVASIIASEMGLVTVMYSAQMGFTRGFSAFYIAFSNALVALVVGLTGFVVVPLRRHGVMTIPEFYERRYSANVRLIGGAILAASGILNMGMFLKADSMFVTSVMGMNSQVQLKIAMTIMLGLVLLYTMLGGMVAVLVTDYMQYVVMAIGLVATSVFLMTRYHWGGIVDAVAAIKGEGGFNPLHGSSLGPGYMIWMLFLGLVGCCLWQTSVMRASSAEDEKVVRRTFAWGSVGFLVRFMIPYFWGIVALVYIAGRPELKSIFLPGGKGAASDVTLRAMPVALSRLVPGGAIGILTAAMLAAAMSTYNTYLHTWSAVLTQDVVGPLGGSRLSHATRIRITRGFMFAIGVFLLVWGLWYPLGENLWDYMAVTGAVYFAGAFAVLVGGLYWRRASNVGAYAAFVCGFLAVAGLTPVQKGLGMLASSLLRLLGRSQTVTVAWPSEHVGLATVGTCALAMIVGSLLFPNHYKKEA